jgi:hypothetical protein
MPSLARRPNTTPLAPPKPIPERMCEGKPVKTATKTVLSTRRETLHPHFQGGVPGGANLVCVGANPVSGSARAHHRENISTPSKSPQS